MMKSNLWKIRTSDREGVLSVRIYNYAFLRVAGYSKQDNHTLTLLFVGKTDKLKQVAKPLY